MSQSQKIHTSSLITQCMSAFNQESSCELLHTSPLVGSNSPEGLFQDWQYSVHYTESHLQHVPTACSKTEKDFLINEGLMLPKPRPVQPAGHEFQCLKEATSHILHIIIYCVNLSCCLSAWLILSICSKTKCQILCFVRLTFGSWQMVLNLVEGLYAEGHLAWKKTSDK